MAKKRLNQIVAVERDVKKSAYGNLTKDHHLMQKAALVNGETAVYNPKDENGQQLPPETKLIQLKVEDELKAAAEKMIPLWDLTLTKDIGNKSTDAEVVLPNGITLGRLPVPTLLFLEKQLQDLHTFAAKLPTLDPDQNWAWSDPKGCYVTEPITSVKTAKAQVPLVLVAPTKEHPAQSQMIVQDIIVGEWTKTKMSAAITEERRRVLVGRIETLQRAVKQARETANLAEVEEQQMGRSIFDFLLAR